MKKSIALLVLVSLSICAQARGQYHGTGSNLRNHHVNGHFKHNGTYVAPHYNTNPNYTQRDNYGTIGNYNPHNGQYGKRYAEF